MKIFNFIKDEVCIPIAAHNLQEAYESFKAEGYKVEVNDIDTDDKDQLKLFDEDNLEADSLKLEGWEPI